MSKEFDNFMNGVGPLHFKCEMEDCPHCAYERQQEYEADLEKEAAIDFAKWLSQDWMSTWVGDKWMWQNTNDLLPQNHKHHGVYYTEEELYVLYLKGYETDRS